MGVMTHVTRRGASYIWRRRIPKRALQSESDGLSTKKSAAIVQVSLGTQDLSTAARRAPLVSAAFDDMIEGMTYTTLTRAHLRQYLESVVQAEVARIEDARLFEAPPASSREWRARWMRDRAEAYALRLLSNRGPGAELLPEDMDHLRAAGFQPRDMAMVAEAHPAEPLDVGLYRTKQKKLARDQRPSFTPEDVSRIFQHPTWHGRQSAARPHTAGDEIVKDALYWVPLVAAYSGLRREEICGLRLEDVVLRCAHPYLDIRQNLNRGLKNTQSRRRVPLHQDLIDLGFPDYCTRLRAAGGVDVFPDLKPGTPTNAFGDTLHHRWHELLKRQIGPDTGGKVFHSFRHYVISQLKRSGVGIDIIRDLVGHLHGNVTEDRYSDRTDLALLAEAVTRLPRVL